MRKRRSGCVVWITAGSVGLVTLCAMLAAGAFVIGEVSAGAPASHLPTPASVYAMSGEVVEWKRPALQEPQMPAMGSGMHTAPNASEGEAGAPTTPWMEISSTEPTPDPFIAPRIESDSEPAGLLPPDAPDIRLPVDGPLTQGYGCSPYYTGVPGPGCSADAFWFHDGLDIAAPNGTPVQAGMAGTVIFADADGDGPLCNRGYRGYGLAVVVDGGDGWQALYAHLSRIDVEGGQTVSPETVIGLSGDTGCVSGAHLHFGLRRDGELVDPMGFVQ